MTTPLVRDRTAWLQGGDAHCLLPPPEVARTWRLVLVGPPGIGKGTQAQLLQRALGTCTLSTGDVFRAARGRLYRAGSALARALAHLDRGELVPDRIVLDLIGERAHCLHCRGGFMLDGFPHNLPQAEAVDALLAREQLSLDAVLSFELPDDEIAARVAGRRVCPQCEAIFHPVTCPPHRPGVCDHCGHALEQRGDDRREAVAARLASHHRVTEPLLAHYRAQGLLRPVDSHGAPEEILGRALASLPTLARA